MRRHAGGQVGSKIEAAVNKIEVVGIKVAVSKIALAANKIVSKIAVGVSKIVHKIAVAVSKIVRKIAVAVNKIVQVACS